MHRQAYLSVNVVPPPSEPLERSCRSLKSQSRRIRATVYSYAAPLPLRRREPGGVFYWQDWCVQKNKPILNRGWK